MVRLIAGQRDGNDGPWSTLDIHVGTPPQPLRVSVGTSIQETWVISADQTRGGCLGNNDPDCRRKRGGLFNVDFSSTWIGAGRLPLSPVYYPPKYRGGGGSGDYGSDTLGLGTLRSLVVKVGNRRFAAVATQYSYLGFLGVGSYAGTWDPVRELVFWSLSKLHRVLRAFHTVSLPAHITVSPYHAEILLFCQS